MTAPSLILLGHGSHDPQVPQVSHQIREGLLAIRPELDIHAAFLDHCAPNGLQVVKKLVGQGVGEIAFVPLLLSDAFNVQAEVPALLNQSAGEPAAAAGHRLATDRSRGAAAFDHRPAAA